MKPDAIAARLTQFTMSALGLLLGGRFLLRLLNADTDNRFVRWVYDNSRPVLDPFLEQFPSVRVGDGFIVELSTLFALVAYAFLAFVVMAVIGTYTRKANNAVPKRTIGLVWRTRQ